MVLIKMNVPIPDTRGLAECMQSVNLSCYNKVRSHWMHTSEFLKLVHFTTFSDSSLSTFFFVSLNAATKAKLSGEGPCGTFMVFVESVLVCNGSPFTLDLNFDSWVRPSPNSNSWFGQLTDIDSRINSDPGSDY
ncbi:hypothetical protein Baya_0818 [Bagarius yarrelli]|uniref:Uncharacterized protein n=1 Tax=Bagarius yarrelli TaxID=175774 RepID=A0A556TJD2_BAGYA|nr:hypothetical protein Baya_0818 [Bagarius yarrelli]